MPANDGDLGIKIHIENLSFSYRSKETLHNIDLEIKRGDFLGLIGPNGSGKSTLLKNISRILTPNRGAVYLEQRELSGLSHKEIARQMAVVPQDTAVTFDFKVEDIVLMGRSPHQGRFQQETEDDLKIVRRAMKLTNTLDLAGRSITELSGGERQRVIIARALAQRPGVMLLDEPTSHLDINYQAEIFDLLKQLNKNESLTVLVVSHDLNLAAQYCDQLLLLNLGRIYAAGTPEEVITRENIREVYNTEVLIRRNVNGRPLIMLISNQKQKSDNLENTTAAKPRIHVIGGGGSASPVLEELEGCGFEISTGVLNIGDSDWSTARIMGLDIVEEAPFSPIRDKAHDENLERIASSAAVVICDFPIGEGNIPNLIAGEKALTWGLPVFILETGSDQNRDYTGGDGERILSTLKKRGARMISRENLISELNVTLRTQQDETSQSSPHPPPDGIPKE